MKIKSLIVCFSLLLTSLTLANSNHEHAITPALGFDRGQIVLTADYEYKILENYGIGGAFYFTPDDDENAYPQIIGLGFQGKVHLPTGDLDAYLRPGISIAKVDTKTKDYTIIAPFFGIGAVFPINESIGVGMEYLSIVNWSEDDLFNSKHNFVGNFQFKF